MKDKEVCGGEGETFPQPSPSPLSAAPNSWLQKCRVEFLPAPEGRESTRGRRIDLPECMSVWRDESGVVRDVKMVA